MKNIKYLFAGSFIVLGLLILFHTTTGGPKQTLKNNEKSGNIINVESPKTDLPLYDFEKRTVEIYKKTSPSVVNITSYKTEYVQYMFDVYPEKSEGQGSGAIIDKKGFIVTNYHVVGDADKVTVTLSQDEDSYEADIVGIDPENDIAVIKIKNPPSTLNAIPLGDSNSLLVGQSVFAIGNPFGLDRTLTGGIISSVSRNIKTNSGNIIEGAIQTDASINPGNSGGPLIDSSGNMIGINTMIISPSSGSVGIGFAIPVSKIKEIVPELIKYGYVKRGWIDATFLPMTKRLSYALNINTETGLMVMQTAQGGEAERAGIRGGTKRAYYGSKVIYIGGDVITEVEGIKITDYSSLTEVLKNKKDTDVVNVKFVRDNRLYSTALKLIDKAKFNSKY